MKRPAINARGQAPEKPRLGRSVHTWKSTQLPACVVFLLFTSSRQAQYSYENLKRGSCFGLFSLSDSFMVRPSNLKSHELHYWGIIAKDVHFHFRSLWAVPSAACAYMRCTCIMISHRVGNI